jgi:hypothetical protein
MPHKLPSALVITMVTLAQGLVTLGLLIAGLGLGFSIPKPIPVVLALALISGAALAGLVARQWWAAIPAALLVIGLGFCAFVVIGIGGIWMHGIEWFFLAFFGLVMLVPIATIVVSLRDKGRGKTPKDASRHTASP